MSNKLILDVLTRANRPYALNDLIEHCSGKDINRTAVQKALNALEAQQLVRAKCVGKQKIYYAAAQAAAPSGGSADKTELRRACDACQKKIEQIQLNIKTKQSQCLELEAKLKTLASVRSSKTLEMERAAVLDEIRELNERLRRNQAAQAQKAQNTSDSAKQQQLTPASIASVTRHYEHVSLAYRKRRRICNEMLDAIMEGYPNTRRALIDAIGIETDEMAEFSI